MSYINKNIVNLDLDSRNLRPINFFEQIKERNELWFKKNKSRIITEKTINCILCSKKIEKVILTWNKIYKIFKCDFCHAYTSNVKTGNIESIYDKHSKSSVKVNPKKFEYFSKERYNYTIKRLNITKNDSNIIDIGCGPGYFVEYLDKKKFKVSGIEVDSDLVEKCLERNLNVSSKNLNELKNKNYNLITLFDVL